jgi:histidinol-phosphatase (PHP family)
MELTNYHTHCNMCDGEGEPKDYVEQAIMRGFGALGFSSHAPLPRPSDWTLDWKTVPVYLETINRLKNEYKDRIEVYLGMEIDYIPGLMGPRSSEFSSLNLDYRIGAVHTYEDGKTGKLYGLDGPLPEFEHILRVLFDGDMQALVRDYFKRIQDMAQHHPPDIIGHLDLIKMRNKDDNAYDESAPWYREPVLETLQHIARAGSILEINTGGIVRGKTETFYPSGWILEECFRLDIPITISADAHSPQDIGAHFEEAAREARNAGYRQTNILRNGGWQSVPLE